MAITDKIRDTKAFYAVAGAGDLAVEKLREVPGRVNKLQEKTDPKDLGGAAVAYVTHVGSRAVEVFDELAERGKKIVSRVENQKASRELEANVKEAASKAKATVTAAKNSVRSSTKAADAASDKIGKPTK